MEWWNVGVPDPKNSSIPGLHVLDRSDGILEYWSFGKLRPIIPTLHHSSAPFIIGLDNVDKTNLQAE
jgi:hypothetical protein